MKKISIFGYYGLGNAGDEAILAALVDGLKLVVPDSRISVYSARPHQTSALHGITAVQPLGASIKGFLIGSLGRNRRNYFKSLFNYLAADLIVIGGGGLFFDTKETNEWIYGYIDLIHKSKKLRKKVVLIGISIGPIFHESSMKAIKEAFEKVDLISVRDISSKNLLVNCGVEEKIIHVVPDLVFTLETEESLNGFLQLCSEETKEKKELITLVPCSYNIKKLGWLEQYRNLCLKLLEKDNRSICLIPMQVNQTHDDLYAIQTIYNQIPENLKDRLILVNEAHHPKITQALIGKSSFVIAERLHGSIMAANTKRPFLSIAYMPKVDGVLSDLGMSDRSISFEDFLSGNFLNGLDGRMDDIAARGQSSIDHTKSAALTNFDLIRNVLL